MHLDELEKYKDITIQAHDNPDADAIASGFALYSYFAAKGKNVSFIYSGRYKIQKTDLKMMIEKLDIPIEYRQLDDSYIKGLIITVDCQYGAGNVYKYKADDVVVIDHHQPEIATSSLKSFEIASSLGSCSTLVWRLLNDAGYSVNDDIRVGTALYYGLFRDTNQFSELYYPLDLDMRDSLAFDRSLFHQMRNSNLSLKELEIAGIALIRYIYNSDYHYAIIQTQPCDPNLLGIISDFIIQVDEIQTCVVFNQLEDGYKFSVRSCINEVNASELAQFLSQDIGSGGGHIEKAGGFLSEHWYDMLYPDMNVESFFGKRLIQYFESYDIIYADAFEPDMSEMSEYLVKRCKLGFVDLHELFPTGTSCILRSLDGDIKLVINDNQCVLVEDDSTTRVISKQAFCENFDSSMENCDLKLEYPPKLRNKASSEYMELTQYMKTCVCKDNIVFFAKKLERGVKLFEKEAETYMLGKPGDYMVVDSLPHKNILLMSSEQFKKRFNKAGE